MKRYPVYTDMISILAMLVCGGPGLAGAVETVSGYTEPVRVAKVAFAEPGILESLVVAEGQSVKAGQVLARLDSKTLEHDLNIAREQDRLQRLRFTQIETLKKNGNLSAEEYERACADSLITSQRVERIIAQIDSRILKAPFDGVVLRVYRELSESISVAQPDVMMIAKLDSLHLVVHVPSDKAAGIKQGGRVRVRLENQFDDEAEVVFVSPVIDAASGTVRVKLAVANGQGRYRSGMQGAVVIDGENQAGKQAEPLKDVKSDKQ